MGLEQIIQKERVIGTPSALDLARDPEEYEKRFNFHVSTYVSIADLTDKWDAILRNLHQKKSSTGLIYSDTGYGKTSTSAALWHYAEERDIVAVPPFMWESMADMLLATHHWVCYRLKSKRPDLIPELEEKYKILIEIGPEDIATRMSQEQGIPLEYARKAIQTFRAEGKILDSVSANGLLDYLNVAVSILLKAGYKGLLILPDEFELFAGENPDIARNFADLKDFIFPIFQENKLPIGCVVSTYRKTLSEIQMRESYMLARFNKPEGNLIDLERVYGKRENGRSFAHRLWDKLSVACELSEDERGAISEDVLEALGQFLEHQRTTAIISGPRSVVATFRRAAIHYSQKKQPYSIFDFCEDYLNQLICFNQQETDTLRSFTSIMAQPIVSSEARQKAVKLLCVFPDGVRPKIFQKHGIADADRQAVVQSLLGTHVITKIIGPTLVNHKDSTETGDQLIEILKGLRNWYNPGSAETHRAAVRAFVNYIVQEIFKRSIASSPTGWSGIRKMESDMEPVFQMQLKGTSIRDYPNRKLTVHVSTNKYREITGAYSHSQLFTSFVFGARSSFKNVFKVENNGIYFRFNIQQPINKDEVPKDISKLGDLFLPESITPSLLLSMLDFFDKEVTISQIKRANQEAQVNLLKSQIVTELIRYFFSQEVKAAAVSADPELEQVPIGKDFVERVLAILTRKLFPEYKSVAISAQWVKILNSYIQYLREEKSLGIKRGVEPILTTGAEVPGLFNVSSHTTFENTYYPSGIWRDILKVDETNEYGETVKEGVEVRNTQRPVAVYFSLHDLEKRILNQLEDSSKAISVDGKQSKALKLPEVFKQEKERGYLNEEIDQLLRIMEARELAERREQQGINYLCLLDTEISLAELESKMQTIEMLDKLARSKGFKPEWERELSPSTLRSLLQADGIESNEILKDSLRGRLRASAENFKSQCGKWLEKERIKLDRKRQEIAALTLDVPRVLEQTRGHATTDFSVLLFQDIQNEVKNAYKSISRKVTALQSEVKETLNRELIQGYVNKENTPEKAVEVAAKLGEFAKAVDLKVDGLRARNSEAERLYELFEGWRILATKVEQDRLIMSEAKDDDAVANLIERLDEEQRLIKQHLADRALSLKDALGSYEHFKNRVLGIKGEFDQITANRQEEFIRFVANIEEQLIKVMDKPNIDEMYNPADERGSYQRAREKAVRKIEILVLGQAKEKIREIKVDLMKPIEVFKVSNAVRNQAITLKEEVLELEKRINTIQSELRADGIEESLPEVAEELVSIRKEGEGIFGRMGRIQKQLRCNRSELSPRAQKLLNLVSANRDRDFTELVIELRQSGDAMFRDAAEIIASLEELYQTNWMNIRVSPTMVQ